MDKMYNSIFNTYTMFKGVFKLRPLSQWCRGGQL